MTVLPDLSAEIREVARLRATVREYRKVEEVGHDE